MAESSGRLAGDMKWLVARYPKPPGTMIKLGSILKDSQEPESSLNLENKISVVVDGKTELKDGISKPENIRDESVAVRATITNELSNKYSALLEVNAPSNPIVTAAAKLNADKSTSAETVVEAMNVRAEIFLPSDDYMEKALAHPKVIEYVKEGGFAKSIYIIIGVATAEKLNLKENTTRDTSAGGSLGLSAAGGAAEAKTELSGEKHAKTNIERQIDVDCDFAYRVREFVYSKKIWKKKKWSNGEDVSEGAMFRDGEEEQDVTVVEEEVPTFDELIDEDEVPSGVYAF